MNLKLIAFYSIMLAIQIFVIFMFLCLNIKHKDLSLDSTNEGITILEKLYSQFFSSISFILLGFGFLSVLYMNYGQSGSSYTLLSFIVSIQIYTIIQKVLDYNDQDNIEFYSLSKSSLIDAFYCALANIITLGAIQGRIYPSLVIIFAITGSIMYSILEYILINWGDLNISSDFGKAVTVHMFGGLSGFLCGIIMEVFIKPKRDLVVESKNGNNIQNLLSTLFLIIYFPSIITYDIQPVTLSYKLLFTIIMTLYCTILGIVSFSLFLDKHKKIDLQIIQHGIMAGGIAISNAAIHLYEPHDALLIGFITGIVTSCYFLFLHKYFVKYDTRGVLFTHFVAAAWGFHYGFFRQVLLEQDISNRNQNYTFMIFALLIIGIYGVSIGFLGFASSFILIDIDQNQEKDTRVYLNRPRFIDYFFFNTQPDNLGDPSSTEMKATLRFDPQQGRQSLVKPQQFQQSQILYDGQVKVSSDQNAHLQKESYIDDKKNQSHIKGITIEKNKNSQLGMINKKDIEIQVEKS